MAEDARYDYDLADEAATAALARRIASIVTGGDLITLSGDLGAGKTTFARELIRELTGDPDQEVPSPTFTLMQVYETKRFPIVHADLYRIKSPDELFELGWDEASEGALLLVEWADRAGPLPETRLDVQLRLDASRGDTHRTATLVASGTFDDRLRRALSIDALLAGAGWGEASRTFMLGDASTRAYERLEKPDGARAILMISPRRPDGPPVYMGKSYSTIARLAETVTPFLAMARALHAENFSAPQIYAQAPEEGLAILEDFGALGIVDDDGPMPERYGAAVSVLAALHTRDLPATIDGYEIPPYDLDALSIEIELLVDWYAPHVARAHLSSGARATFVSIWRDVLNEIVSGPRTWTLRDYHSPNLMWLPDRDWLHKVGLLDFQDCVMGHPAYDLASLLQDARVTVSDTLEMKLLGQYLRQRREDDPAFDIESFARAYAIMGAQRATKVLGIFARLDKRDDKPGYLAHIPRVRQYLLKDLSHPALGNVKVWFETHMPMLFAKDDA